MNEMPSALLMSLLVALLNLPAHAQSPEPPLVHEAPRPHTNEASDRGFSALMHVVSSAEAERFLHEWNTTPAAHAPRLTAAGEARRGDTVSTIIVYSGCAADKPAGSVCPARMDLRIVAPDGSTYGEYTDIRLAESVPTAHKVVQLSPVDMRIEFEPHDKPGRYRVLATIRDPSRDIVLSLETGIELLPGKPKE